MRRVMVRYKVKADRAAENRQLIEKVFEELKAAAPAGVRYASFVLEDGVSFVHIASIETTDGSNPLGNLAAFGAFQKAIEERCFSLRCPTWRRSAPTGFSAAEPTAEKF